MVTLTDPLHLGHLIHMKMAKALGDKLIVIVNSDASGISKKGFCLVPLEERMAMLRELSFVDEVVASIDRDDTVAKTLQLIRPNIFAKGGTKTLENIPEIEQRICEQIGCELVTGIGEITPYHSSTDFILSVVEKFQKL